MTDSYKKRTPLRNKEVTKIGNSRCLSENEIALFLDMVLSAAEKSRVVAHLRGCRRCRSLCMDDARFVAAWRAGEFDLFPAPDPQAVSPRRPVPSRSRVSRVFRPATAAVSVLIVAAVTATLLITGPIRNGLPGDLTGPVLTAVETASRNGLAVIPGGENSLDPRPSTFRSGTVSGESRLKDSLDRLAGLFESNDADEEVAYWLVAGYLSRGRNALARVIAGEAVERFPGDVRLRVLYGVAKYAEGNLEGAAIELRRAAEIRPRDPVVQVNLGLVLLETGQTVEAGSVLNDVIERYPDKPVGRRARTILQTSTN